MAHNTLIVQITDSHIADNHDFLKKGINVRQSLQAVINDIQKHHPSPDVLIHSGDMTEDGTDAAYAYIAEQMARLDCPILAIPGNHDIPQQFQQACQQYAWLQHWHIGAWQVIGIDSTLQGQYQYSGIIGQAELDRLKQTLTNGKNTIVVVHHYPYNHLSHRLDKMGIDNAQALYDLVNVPHVKAVLCGHVHHAWQTNAQGILWASTPSTCIQFTLTQHKVDVDLTAPPAYRILKVANNKVTTQVKNVTI